MSGRTVQHFKMSVAEVDAIAFGDQTGRRRGRNGEGIGVEIGKRRGGEKIRTDITRIDRK